MDDEINFTDDSDTDETNDSAAYLTALGIFAGGALTGVIVTKSWGRLKDATAKKREAFVEARAAKKALKAKN